MGIGLLTDTGAAFGNAIYDVNRDMYVTNGGIANAQQAMNGYGTQQFVTARTEFEREYQKYQAAQEKEKADDTLAFMSNTKTKVLLTEGE